MMSNSKGLASTYYSNFWMCIYIDYDGLDKRLEEYLFESYEEIKNHQKSWNEYVLTEVYHQITRQGSTVDFGL